MYSKFSKRVARASAAPQLPFFHPSLILRIIFLGIALAGLPFFLRAAVAAFVKSEAENFLVGVRTELVYGEGGLGPTIYFVGFSFVSYAFSLIAKIRQPNLINRILLWVSLLVALVYAVFSTGRTTFLIIIGLYAGLRHVLDSKFNLRIFLWIIPVFAIVFAMYGMIFGKGGDYEDSLSNNLQASSQNTAVYVVVPLSAFDYEIHHPYEVNGAGNYTLRFFYVAAQSFGFISRVPFDAGLINNFVFVPYANNVYTIYSSYMKDFGIGYALIIVFLFGILQSWLYTKAVRTKNYKFAIYYAMLLYPLIMSFFADQYIGLFSQWLQFVIYVELFFLLNKIVFISKHGRYSSNKLERRVAAT